MRGEVVVQIVGVMVNGLGFPFHRTIATWKAKGASGSQMNSMIIAVMRELAFANIKVAASHPPIDASIDALCRWWL